MTSKSLIHQRYLDIDYAAFRQSRPSESQKTTNKAKAVPNTSTTIKRTTANSNEVAITSTSVAPAPKGKKG
jgi:hypothetical protein